MSHHEYQLTTAKKRQLFFYAALLILLAGLSFKNAIDPVGEFYLWLLLGLAFFIPGVLLISLARRSRVILDENRIEFRSAMRTFNADRNEIEGLRRSEDQDGRSIRICLKDDRGAFTVSESFIGYGDINEWLKGLPDLDERDAAQVALRIKHSGSLGATEDQRVHALDRARAWAIGLSTAAVLAGFLVVLVPYAPLYTASLVLLLLCAPLGILLLHRFPLLFTLSTTRTDPRAYVGVMIGGPGIAMLISYRTGGNPTHLIDASQLVFWSLLVLLFYLAALFRMAWHDPFRWGALTGLLITGSLYGFGLVNAVNTLADRSLPRVYSSVVLKKHRTYGKFASYYLRVAQWGPLADDREVTVHMLTYHAVNVGDQICFGLHRGFLHAPWYTLVHCQEPASAPAPRSFF